MGNTYSPEKNDEYDDWRSPKYYNNNTSSQTNTLNSFGNSEITDTDQVVDNESPQKYTLSQNIVTNKTCITESEDSQRRHSNRVEELDLFKKELLEKRLERQSIMENKRKEIQDLRDELISTKEENEKLKKMLEDNNILNTNQIEDTISTELGFLRNEVVRLKEKNEKLESIITNKEQNQNDFEEMKKQVEFLNSEMESIEHEREAYKNHVIALKECVAVSKQMLELRDKQLAELKLRIDIIQKNLRDREAIMMSEELRTDYERQLRNIRNLRTLYEERARMERVECRKMAGQLADTRLELEAETNKNNELQQRISELETDVSHKYDQIASLQSELGLAKAECNGLNNEMTVINQLFAQILSSSNSFQDVDLDKLIKGLEENHDLLSDIVIKEDSSETSAALPKLILELVSQMNQNKIISSEEEDKQTENNTELHSDVNTSYECVPVSACTEKVSDGKEKGSPSQGPAAMADEIASNLPKVWKVLTELLSHQSITPVKLHQSSDGQNPCYTSVNTPSGSRYVLSVSKTYIRLKDLIVEKRFLQKEMMRMKCLNTHLEDRLRDQEKRMAEVSSELVKTWHMAGKLQRQHHKLHTHEKILRYELSQKRKLLTELKDELEYCRQNWEKAREKNNDSEAQCQLLRSEFTLRKSHTYTSLDIQSGSESGFSDEAGNEDSDCGEALIEQNDGSAIVHTLDIADTSLQNDSTEPNSTCSDVENDESKSLSTNYEDDVNLIHSNVSLDSNLVETNCDDNKVPNSNKHNDNMNECEDLDESQITTGEKASNETSTDNNSSTDIEEMLLRRERKFKSLEEQFTQLKNKYENQTKRGSEMCTKMDTLHEKYGKNDQLSEPEPSSSTSVLDEREARFKRLEEECNALKKKYATQSEKGEIICIKLDGLHKQFGSDKNETNISEEAETNDLDVPGSSTDIIENSTKEETESFEESNNNTS